MTTTGEQLARGPFVGMPPRRGNIKVPVSSRRAALTGLAMYAPCRASRLLAHHAGWAAVAALGPRVLPDQRRGWEPPTGPDTWGALCEQWRETLGDVDAMAVYERPQTSRSGVGVLLLREGRSVAYVKVRADDRRLVTSCQALEALAERPSRVFAAPRPLATGASGSWHWLALAAIPPLPSRPPRRPPLRALVADIQDRLGQLRTRDGHPPHWVPMHGDLTPWNLRTVGARSLWLLDWEEVGWGPPGADIAYYAATARARSGRAAAALADDGSALHDDEVRSFWLQRVSDRSSADFDSDLNRALLRTFGGSTSTTR